MITPEQCTDRLDNLSKFKGIVLMKDTVSVSKKSFPPSLRSRDDDDDGGNGPRDRTILAQPAKVIPTTFSNILGRTF